MLLFQELLEHCRQDLVKLDKAAGENEPFSLV